MRASFVSAAVLALVSSVYAQDATDGFDVFTSPASGAKVVAGKPFDITWVPGPKPEYLNGTATIKLAQGKDKGSLNFGPTIATGVKNSLGKYTWDIPASIVGFGAYGLHISLEDDKSTTQDESKIFQWSSPFQIVAAEDSASGTTTVIIGTGPNYTPTPTPTPSATRNSTETSTTILTTTTPASNLSTTSTRSSSTRTSTTTGPAQQSTNAAVANVVSGGLALVGGVMLAFAV